ncbi:MAG: glycosyltransferase family 39 protein, partial [Phycisphaerae bacterium]|nr:glycosyltransferase family 39 protein [Phycisphaerae bacterium]
GFQPLYVFLMVPVYLLVPAGNLTLPVHIAGTLLAIAGTATAGVFYLIALRLFSRLAALCVLFFFTISHYFVATDINGLETSLYGLTLSGTLYYYLTRFVQGRSPSHKQCAVLGVLAGLTMLARVDAGFFLVCVALHFVWERRRASVLREACTDGWVAHGFSRGGHESANQSCPPPLKRWATQHESANHSCSPPLKRWGTRAVVGSAFFFITLGPWLTANVVLCKTISPASGPAVRFLAIQNGWKPAANLVGYTGPERFTEDDIPWQYYANNLLHLTAQVIAFLPITAHAQGFSASFLPNPVDRFPIGRLLARAPWAALTCVVLLAGVVLFGPLLFRRLRLRASTGLGAVAFLRFAVAGWIGAYGFWVLCPWYSHRYMYPVLALLTLASGAVLDTFFRVLGKRRAGLRAALLILGAVVYAFLFVNQTRHYYTAYRSPGEPDHYSPVLPWIKEHVPADATIGCFQSGILSYFLPNRCVNLDGVVNSDALRATRQRRLWEYVRREGVDYIVDWPVCIEGLLTTFGGVEHLPLEVVCDRYDMDVYRVVDTPRRMENGEMR